MTATAMRTGGKPGKTDTVQAVASPLHAGLPSRPVDPEGQPVKLAPKEVIVNAKDSQRHLEPLVEEAAATGQVSDGSLREHAVPVVKSLVDPQGYCKGGKAYEDGGLVAGDPDSTVAYGKPVRKFRDVSRKGYEGGGIIQGVKDLFTPSTVLETRRQNEQMRNGTYNSPATEQSSPQQPAGQSAPPAKPSEKPKGSAIDRATGYLGGRGERIDREADKATGYAAGGILGDVSDWLGEATHGVVGTNPNVLETRRQNAAMEAGLKDEKPFDQGAFDSDLKRFREQSRGLGKAITSPSVISPEKAEAQAPDAAPQADVQEPEKPVRPFTDAARRGVYGKSTGAPVLNVNKPFEGKEGGAYEEEGLYAHNSQGFELGGGIGDAWNRGVQRLRNIMGGGKTEKREVNPLPNSPVNPVVAATATPPTRTVQDRPDKAKEAREAVKTVGEFVTTPIIPYVGKKLAQQFTTPESREMGRLHGLAGRGVEAIGAGGKRLEELAKVYKPVAEIAAKTLVGEEGSEALGFDEKTPREPMKAQSSTVPAVAKPAEKPPAEKTAAPQPTETAEASREISPAASAVPILSEEERGQPVPRMRGVDFGGGSYLKAEGGPAKEEPLIPPETVTGLTGKQTRRFTDNAGRQALAEAVRTGKTLSGKSIFDPNDPEASGTLEALSKERNLGGLSLDAVARGNESIRSGEGAERVMQGFREGRYKMKETPEDIERQRAAQAEADRVHGYFDQQIRERAERGQAADRARQDEALQDRIDILEYRQGHRPFYDVGGKRADREALKNLYAIQAGKQAHDYTTGTNLDVARMQTEAGARSASAGRAMEVAKFGLEQEKLAEEHRKNLANEADKTGRTGQDTEEGKIHLVEGAPSRMIGGIWEHIPSREEIQAQIDKELPHLETGLLSVNTPQQAQAREAQRQARLEQVLKEINDREAARLGKASTAPAGATKPKFDKETIKALHQSGALSEQQALGYLTGKMTDQQVMDILNAGGAK